MADTLENLRYKAHARYSNGGTDARGVFGSINDICAVKTVSFARVDDNMLRDLWRLRYGTGWVSMERLHNDDADAVMLAQEMLYRRLIGPDYNVYGYVLIENPVGETPV